MKTTALALIWLLTIGFAFPTFAENDKPRIGLETETAFHNDDGQLLIVPTSSEWSEKAGKILQFWKNVYGGEIREIEGKTQLDWGQGRPGTFRIDKEWASDASGGDGYEIVTPPLDFEDAQKYIQSYDALKTELGLTGGIKTSQQFNIELRNLIPGFSLRERPTSKLGVAYSEIQNANVSKVVDLFLFLERNVHFIYAAYAPKRLGNLVNYFAVPMSFEHEQLLKELEALPPEQRTYARVRQVFMSHEAEEDNAAEFGGRTDWKYRTFNMRKFFAFNDANPTWVYPAIEVRLPDTPTSGAELKKQIDLTYALFEVGSRSGAANSQDGQFANASYRSFLKMYRKKLSFAQAIRVVNQDMVARSLTPEFKAGYATFLKHLKLKPEDYPAFAGAEASPFISQTYDVYRLIRSKKETQFLDRTIKVSDVEIPWDLKEFSYGAEFEFGETAGVLERLKQIPFLESEVTIESTGNREVITKPTGDIHEYLRQLQYMRDFFGDDLKSIHVNFRFPKNLYERISKQKFDSWIARVSDWISVLRANYRNPKYAFRTRTLNRMQVDTPNSWIGDDKAEYRGTMRIYLAGERMNVEIRGLMDGIYEEAPLEPDLHAVALLIILTGIQNPDLIEGNYAHRLVGEVRDPKNSFEEVMRKFAIARGEKLETQPHKVSDLVKAMRAPNLMLFPLMGFEYLPLISGHDVKRMQNATHNWKASVWKVLSDSSLDEEKAKEGFVKTLKEWSKSSNLEYALMDSLLVRPAPGMSWAELNLPVERMRPGFLNKMVQMQSSEFAKAGIELFLTTWLRKDPKSLVQTAKQLESEQLQKLVSIVDIHESPTRARTFLKEVGVAKPKTRKPEQKAIPIFTNLEALAQKDTPRLAPHISPAIIALPAATTELLPEIPEPSRLYDVVAAAPESRRVDIIERFIAHHPDLNRKWETLSAANVLNGDDVRIQQLIKVQSFLPAEKQSLLDGTRNTLYAYVIYVSKFNEAGTATRNTMKALKDLSGNNEVTEKKYITALVKEFVRLNSAICCTQSYWKTFIQVMDEWTGKLSPERRLEYLSPATEVALRHVADKVSSNSDVRDHLEGIAPFLTKELLLKHASVADAFRTRQMRFGPPGLSQVLPSPQVVEHGGGRRCSQDIFSNMCPTCPNRHRGW